jgi:hypothetical protein
MGAAQGTACTTAKHRAAILEGGEEPPGGIPLWSYQVAIDLDHFSAVADHVQHQSAATAASLTDRPRPLTTSSTGQKTFSDPAATSYGSGGRA